MKRHVFRVCVALSAFAAGVLCARLAAVATPYWLGECLNFIVPVLLFTASAICFMRAFPNKLGPRRGVLYRSLALFLSAGLLFAVYLALGLEGVISSHR